VEITLSFERFSFSGSGLKGPALSMALIEA
jgi:hypothetical protein